MAEGRHKYIIFTLYWARKKYLYVVARMLQVEAEVVSNSRIQPHQTTYKYYFRAEYIHVCAI